MLSVFASSQIIRHAAHVLGRVPFTGSFLGPSVGNPCAKIFHGPASHVRHMSMEYTNPRSFDPNIEWARMSKAARMEEEVPPDPYSGRRVFVGANGNNLPAAFKRLDAILSRNKVRTQAVQSERHEQKGAKRRRLSSERWRRRFAHEVRLKVQLVQKIHRRGA